MYDYRRFQEGPYKRVSQNYEVICDSLSRREIATGNFKGIPVHLRDFARCIRGEIGPEQVEIVTETGKEVGNGN
jgi:hypothetical protein